MTKIKEGLGLSFDDVLLVPQKGTVKSRDDVSLSTHLGGNYWLSNPIVASPMSTVCDSVLARRLSELGGIGIIHRFMTVKEQVEHFRLATASVGLDGDVYKPPTHWAGVAIGISEKNTYERIEKLFEAGATLFAIDTAHGHSDNVSSFMGHLSESIQHSSTFISGSISTASAARFSAESGFHTVRVGIGNGSACSTRQATGYGVPQLTALMEVKEALDGIKTNNGLPIRIISCGGIRHGSDAVKALAAGADAIMLGQYLAGTNESPEPGVYRGEASAEAKGSVEYVEGESGKVNVTGTLEDTIRPLLHGIRSGISYSGGRNIRELQSKAEFLVTAPGVKTESEVRIKNG